MNELWKQFNLGENNPDPGGYLLYLIRYDSERLRGHQEQIINILENSDLELEETGDNINVKISKKDGADEVQGFYLLLEELSCINGALEFYELGIRWNSISDMKGYIMSSFYGKLEKSIVDAYEVVNFMLPSLIKDLRIADQNNVLSNYERHEVEDLISWAKRQDEILNSNKYALWGLK